MRFSSLWLLLACFSPLFLALFISATRICNYYHAPADVLSGMVFGGVIALLSYFAGFGPMLHKDVDAKRLSSVIEEQ